ncbi:unnamed protein product [Caenorhabditis sp. 36 PRJEB53466]|nr:unnamed protein product [Caenorhabditis sp. 36 PRJEB53466]
MWPTTIIFMVLALLIIAFTIVMSHFAKFNPLEHAVYKPEFAYSVQDTRELLTNACKLPYIFLSNDDVADGRDDFRNDCMPKSLSKYINFSSNGVLTLKLKQKMGAMEQRKIVFGCSYYKHSGVSNISFEIEDGKPLKVPFYNFAVTCKKDGIVEYLKPLVNFAVIPKEFPGDSVAILFLPSMNHKFFMKSMVKSKKALLDNRFLFAKMMTMKDTKPFQDLLLQLGIPKEESVFQKAKQMNFTTFFSGPRQIRDLIETDYDTMDHRNFIFQFLIDDNQCLEDGRKFVDDQLERVQHFLSTTNGSKFFSTMFLDDYGQRKRAIDYDLSEVIRSLEREGVFKNTTLIITSYDLSEKELSKEDEKNPLFAVKLSEAFVSLYPRSEGILNMNFNRLMTSPHVSDLILNLLDPNATALLSPLSRVQPTLSSCQTFQIPESLCPCMTSNNASEYPSAAEEEFLTEVRGRFLKEIRNSTCLISAKLNNEPIFYKYLSTTKGDVRVVELSAQVITNGTLGKRNVPVKKTFVFEPMFKSFRSFDTARVIINYGVNVGIDR